MSFARALGRGGRLARPWRVSLRRPRRFRLTPRLRLVMAVAVLLGGLLFGAWLWLRDSSLVSVRQVTVTGESGPQAGAIRLALRAAARNMTTLDVQMSQLRTAVAPFPEIRDLRVSTSFPHRMVITVIERRPVALIDVGGRQVPVSGDGTLLPTASVGSAMPAIPLTVPPVGRRLPAGQAADAVAVLAAAPYRLLPKISQVVKLAGRELVAQLRNGPSIYFGDTGRLAAKWVAAIDVLADPGSTGATYIDVTDPARPAAGSGSSAASSTTPSTQGSATSPDTSAAATTAGSSSAATSTTPSSTSTSTVPGG